MDDPKSKKSRQDKGLPGTGPQGIGVPAKGDSSSSNAPLSSDDGATISDTPLTPPPTEKPATRVPRPDSTYLDVSSRSGLGRELSGAYLKETVLNPGDVLGGRYEIVQLLGEGGMGAVYKARDREVDRTVALKLIRPELASNPTILARFKQELLTAHQVTHKNVIRIYDIAEADGVKFITMEYVDGSDLRHILIENGKLAPERAIEIIRQVCLALEAAHSAGVIHRDLKPQNIMQDSKTGRLLVMDFGLARSIESEGMTQTGALLGTIEYMSPEQSMGKPLDQRSDIFAVGLIFYEMLTGKTPYKADTAMASLLRRNQERATPAADLDASVPKGLSDIVSKCLERELTNRYQNVQEILQDLDAYQGARPTLASISTLPVAPPKPTLPWKWIGIGSLVLVMLAGGWVLRTGLVRTGSSTAGSGNVKVPELSLAILPFRNASGDSSLDWLGPTLADMLSTGVGQSSQLRVISPERLHQVLSDLRITAESPVDATMISHIAESSSANTVFWGKYVRYQDKVRIEGTLQDLKHGRNYPIALDAPAEKDVSGTVTQIAEQIRRNLSVSADVMNELRASSFQPSSKSTVALRNYTQGVQMLRVGRNLDAVKMFDVAIKEDPNFALAHSRLAEAESALGYDSEAEQFAQKGWGLSENLPPAEKYLITAIRDKIGRNYPEAIRAYENLARASPGNTDVRLSLAKLYEDSGASEQASEQYQRILTSNPKDIVATLAMARIALSSGNAQASLEPLNRALSLSIQSGNDEQWATSLHAIGYAYALLNKSEEALSNYDHALGIRRRIGEKRGIAKSLNRMAGVEASLGRNKVALAHFEEALQVSREIGDKRGQGDILLDLGNFYDDSGDHERSLKLFKESLRIERDIGNESLQAICLNNIGSVYFSKGEYQDALTYFQQALQLREKSNVPQDIVESVHNVAETSVRMGQYDQAVSQYMRALKLRRSVDDARGAAIESYSIGTLFEYQGRFGAAINSKQEALKTFRDLKERSFWMAEILGGYAESLTLAGRGQESKQYLDEALSLSRELKNDGLVAQTLVFEGDVSYYRGEANSALPLYAQAVLAAAHSKEPEKVLIAKIGLAKAEIEAGRAAAAVTSLRPLARQAEDQGFAYMAVECSVYMADGMLRSHDSLHARQELERALLQAEKLGLKPLMVKAHYLLGTALRSSGQQDEAKQHYREAVQLLDGMRNDPGADRILQRSDFKTMHEGGTSSLTN
jgi:serine/threonine protein kinase/tetratricopeptide (TPR) repeat protein